VQPFPTPENEQGLQIGLNGLDQIWFLHYPSFGAQPELWALKYNIESQGWDFDRLSIDLDFPAPRPGPDPGPVLLQFHLSPDGKWLVADYAYRGSQLIDLLSGKLETPAININSYWKFFTWMPTNSSLVSADEEYPQERIQHINLDTEEAKIVLLSEIEDNAFLRGMAYSPDGNHLASAIKYTSSIDDKKTEIATVTLENDTKRTLVNLLNGVSFVDHSLKWSPDGKKLLWIAQIVNDEGISETKLWVAGIETGLVEAEVSLGKSVQYNHTAAWSPDGTTVAFLKTETVKNSHESSNNLYVINLDTGQESNVTNYSNQLLSHLQWLSDSERIAFLMAVGEYGEIWITNLDGSEEYTIAGPTLPNTPYLLISEGD
jgi:dipeptidyl aminopeptidase/acylaminoacyl peptidase